MKVNKDENRKLTDTQRQNIEGLMEYFKFFYETRDNKKISDVLHIRNPYNDNSEGKDHDKT